MKKESLLKNIIIFVFITVSNQKLLYAQDNSDIRDIKPPIDYPFNPILIIILSILLLLLIFLFIFYLRKKGKKLELKTNEIMKAPWEIAFEELEKLRKKNLISQGKIKEYYSILSDIIRVYFENQFNIRAPEMTTEEFMYYLKDLNRLRADQKDVLEEFLFSCDMVKFAKYSPDSMEIDKSFDLAKQLVNETKGSS